MNPEHYDYLLERLFEAGAVDAWMTPIVMKKTRPAVLLSALCEQSAVEAVKRQIFTHSTTLGVRTHEVSKSALRRESATVETQYGQARVKKSFYNGKTVRCKPESDDCRRLASTSGLTLSEIENIISRHCELEKQSGTGNQNNQK
jgi:uncharacterized protein (DUF111 family)